MPLPSRREHVAGAHKATMRHVGACRLIQKKELARFLKPRHVAILDVFPNEEILAALSLREQVLDGRRRPEVVLERPLQLRLEVPMLEHLVGDLRREALQISEGQAGLPLGAPILPLPMPILHHVIDVIFPHTDAIGDLLEHVVRYMQKGVEGSNAKVFEEGAFVLPPNLHGPLMRQVHGVPFVMATQRHLPERKQHLPPGVSGEVVLNETPLVAIAPPHEML
mmetsp:Transcript_75159/g.229960  ORF Transcript_75159/g.229960 Transcript_75159/m.229960 type:complete len:223 (-) Transcript_75159:918-1586(-)